MPVFGIAVKKPYVPPPQWTSIFDNTKWTTSGFFGSWSGSEWDSEGGKSGYIVWLDELGTWVEGYRPTKIRVTHTVPGTTYLRLRDLNSVALFIELTYTSGDEIDITFQGADMKELQVGNGEVNPYTVTNIEFYA